MAKISVLIACFNEEENVIPLSEALVNIFQTQLSSYDYEIVFIDNHSEDTTRQKLDYLCGMNKNIKAIFNAKNFGQIRSPFHGLRQTTGDCTILMCADFQDPPEMIVKFVHEWEQGYKIVIGIKTQSKETRLMYFLRSLYYRTLKKISEVEQIEHFTGFGLYDKDFIAILRDLDDPCPYLRGLIGELGYDRKEIPYVQPKRMHGKSKNNFFSLYDYAMIGITSYSKTLLRVATFLGFIVAGCSLIVAIIYLVLKLVFWNSYPAGQAPLTIGLFFLGSVQLIFIGLLGEYILSINTRIMKRPLVVEEKRLNFEHSITDDKQQIYIMK
jgi:glycosyltransferase involved in cell wall biosynthesis